MEHLDELWKDDKITELTVDEWEKWEESNKLEDETFKKDWTKTIENSVSDNEREMEMDDFDELEYIREREEKVNARKAYCRNIIDSSKKPWK